MVLNKYVRLIEELKATGTGKMKCFGFSMMPILQSGSTCTYQAQKAYKEGDIVFCKVQGRYIDAHKIVKLDAAKGYLIANNAGHENGWTRLVYGRVVEAEMGKYIKKVKRFDQ
jgi:hypothetical protein